MYIYGGDVIEGYYIVAFSYVFTHLSRSEPIKTIKRISNFDVCTVYIRFRRAYVYRGTVTEGEAYRLLYDMSFTVLICATKFSKLPL